MSNPKSSRWNSQPPFAAPPAESARVRRAIAAVLIILAVATSAALAALRVQTLFAWQYTSDLFSIDQALQETLRGNFGLEYTFGSIFGDHAYYLLPLFLPLKLLLGHRAVRALLLFGPLCYLAYVLAAFFIFRRLTGSKRAVFAIIPLMFPPLLAPGLHEPIYGLHVDTYTGFLAVTFTLLLVLRERAGEPRGRRQATVAFMAVYLLFLLSKEEMALLGVVFFLILLLLRREPFHRSLLILSVAVFLLELALVHLAKTNWNGRNMSLLIDLIGRIRDGTAASAIHSRQAQTWLGAMLSLIVVGTAAALSGRRASPCAMALFAAGLAKLMLSLLVWDFALMSWHNFPGLIMCLGAIVLQLVENGDAPRRGGRIASALLLAAIDVGAITMLITIDVPYVQDAYSINVDGIAVRNSELKSLRRLQVLIDPRKVVAISPRTELDWINGYRFTFFPRGVQRSPRGIADYIVLDRRTPYDPNALGEFAQRAANQHFVLLERRSLAPDHAARRARFIERFGPAAIGDSGRPWPVPAAR